MLAIGAHPDDIELGCGATLTCHRQRGDDHTLRRQRPGRGHGDDRAPPRESYLGMDPLAVPGAPGGPARRVVLYRGLLPQHHLEATPKQGMVVDDQDFERPILRPWLMHDLRITPGHRLRPGRLGRKSLLRTT